MLHDKLTLRDKKKEATAAALAETAFELALEHGLDGFIVDDVVKKAGYSRRTFANYFSCKEEAVAAGAVTVKNEEEYTTLLFASLPPDTTPLDMLYRLMTMQLTKDFLLKLRRFVSLAKGYPTLEPYSLSILHRLQMAAQQLLAEFAGERYPAEYTHLLAGAVYGAFVPVLDGSMNVLLPGEEPGDQRDAITFEQYLNSTFAYLRNGF
ncbi:TetR/AcrR family transcriptional regulator [Paenibacillus aurantiacus]|uniref:TetR/AcrR family transcriptional regulator n=1 Tax=Paenibacillus aurantiacus TaxID=1936118 RepID=A0ABV5KUR7_9BACL